MNQRGFPKSDLEHLLDLASDTATMYFGGHYTLFSFTTGYKFMFGTPDDVRLNLADIEIAPSMELAIASALNRHMQEYIRVESKCYE